MTDDQEPTGPRHVISPDIIRDGDTLTVIVRGPGFRQATVGHVEKAPMPGGFGPIRFSGGQILDLGMLPGGGKWSFTIELHGVLLPEPDPGVVVEVDVPDGGTLQFHNLGLVDGSLNNWWGCPTGEHRFCAWRDVTRLGTPRQVYPAPPAEPSPDVEPC